MPRPHGLDGREPDASGGGGGLAGAARAQDGMTDRAVSMLHHVLKARDQFNPVTGKLATWDVGWTDTGRTRYHVDASGLGYYPSQDSVHVAPHPKVKYADTWRELLDLRARLLRALRSEAEAESESSASGESDHYDPVNWEPPETTLEQLRAEAERPLDGADVADDPMMEVVRLRCLLRHASFLYDDDLAAKLQRRTRK